MKCLVTGGAGFIGSNLVKQLLALGHDVICWDDLSTGRGENLDEHYNLETVIADVEDPPLPFSTSDIPKFDVIYHMAALARIQPSFLNPIRTFKVNCHGTMRMLELARKTGAKFVYPGSSSFYFDKYANPYTFTKWAGEEMCILYNRVYDVSTVTARFFNVYGPNQITEGPYATVIGIFERQYAAGDKLTVTGTGEQRRDFTHVYDIVNGLIRLGDRKWKAEIFNLGTGTNYSINEIAAMFKGAEVEYIPARPGEADVTKADIKETAEVLGWTPTISIEDYIADYVMYNK